MSYNTKRFGIIYGVLAAKGLQSEADMVWEFEDDQSEAFSDVRGESGIIVHNNQTKATARCTLQANSPTHEKWVAQYEAAKLSGAQLPVMLYDRNDSTAAVYATTNGSPKRVPNLTRNRNEPVYEWEFTIPFTTASFPIPTGII